MRRPCEFFLAFEALGVHAKQDFDAVAGPFGDLSWCYSPVEPSRQARVTQIVGARCHRVRDYRAAAVERLPASQTGVQRFVMHAKDNHTA